VSRDFIRNCRTPILVLPDDTPAHPLRTSIDVASAPVELPNIPKAFSLVSRLTVCDQKSPTHYNRNFDSSVKHARPSTA
jgi:hypothetical protein